MILYISSVQFSRSVMSDPLRPHGVQHARPPCPSPTPGVHSNSCPLSQWCHSTISSSVVPFSSRLQSSPASGSFPMSQLFASGGQSITRISEKEGLIWFLLWSCTTYRGRPSHSYLRSLYLAIPAFWARDDLDSSLLVKGRSSFKSVFNGTD